MSVLRVNKITDESGTGPVEFSKGVSFPSSIDINNTMSINSTSGILTANSLKSTNVSLTGVCTATTFYGVGSGLTNLPGTSTKKAIALILIT